MPKMKPVIGLDFDNTLVSYDEVMRQTALDWKLIEAGSAGGNKQQVRDQIRALPDGEIKWQKLQAEVYGKRMNQAHLIEGVEKFLKACKAEGIQTFIVSHKTKHAAQDQEGINLQEAALNWMKEKGFFSRLGLSQNSVYFEDSREEKAQRIGQLGCTHFIDDLQEVFLEKGFPQATVRILYAPIHEQVAQNKEWSVFHSWEDIYQYFFNKQPK
jgi:hypothetical protein